MQVAEDASHVTVSSCNWQWFQKHMQPLQKVELSTLHARTPTCNLSCNAMPLRHKLQEKLHRVTQALGVLSIDQKRETLDLFSSLSL